jgi:hypothetical protein
MGVKKGAEGQPGQPLGVFQIIRLLQIIPLSPTVNIHGNFIFQLCFRKTIKK